MDHPNTDSIHDADADSFNIEGSLLDDIGNAVTGDDGITLDFIDGDLDMRVGRGDDSAGESNNVDDDNEASTDDAPPTDSGDTSTDTPAQSDGDASFWQNQAREIQSGFTKVSQENAVLRDRLDRMEAAQRGSSNAPDAPTGEDPLAQRFSEITGDEEMGRQLSAAVQSHVQASTAAALREAGMDDIRQDNAFQREYREIVSDHPDFVDPRRANQMSEVYNSLGEVSRANIEKSDRPLHALYELTVMKFGPDLPNQDPSGDESGDSAATPNNPDKSAVAPATPPKRTQEREDLSELALDLQTEVGASNDSGLNRDTSAATIDEAADLALAEIFGR